jgi:hypothetical protein
MGISAGHNNETTTINTHTQSFSKQISPISKTLENAIVQRQAHRPGASRGAEGINQARTQQKRRWSGTMVSVEGMK